MSSNIVNLDWNKYEVALLIEAYLDYSSGKVSRKEAVSTLSKRLREGMVKLGVHVGETYRNENGISFQMSYIQVALGGEHGLRNPSKLFCEIADLYKEDEPAFMKLLSVANQLYPKVEKQSNPKTYQYLQFEAEDYYEGTFVAESIPMKYINLKIKKVLEQKFPNGYRLSSSIEAKRMVRFYKEMYGEDLDADLDDIDEDVKACGIVYEKRVYIPQLMLSEDIKNRLVQYIKDTFSSGKSYIFYSLLFKHFHDEFLDSKINDETMLRLYLEEINNHGWYFSAKYLSSKPYVEVNVLNEVLEFVKDAGLVVTVDEIISELSYLPEDAIERALSSRDPHLVSNGRRQWFHIDNFELSEEELDAIRQLIARGVAQYGYVIFAELYNDIKNQQPQVIGNNEAFSDLSLRKVLSYKLEDEYSFNNNVISRVEDKFNSDDCFASLSKKDNFTLQDVDALAKACGTEANAIIGKLLKSSCRVSEEQFVSNSFVHFDIDETDAILAKICHDDYIPLCDVDSLSVLPECGYVWTPFLLESYVYNHSKSFKLIQAGYFSQKKVMGAIVKRSSNIDTYKELAARTVSDAGVELTTEAVLDVLFAKGYIGRKTVNKELEEIMTAARLLKAK